MDKTMSSGVRLDWCLVPLLTRYEISEKSFNPLIPQSFLLQNGTMTIWI